MLHRRTKEVNSKNRFILKKHRSRMSYRMISHAAKGTELINNQVDLSWKITALWADHGI